jgi:hypothetical protein
LVKNDCTEFANVVKNPTIVYYYNKICNNIMSALKNILNLSYATTNLATPGTIITPSTSTNTAIVRWNGTTGNNLANSTVLLSNEGDFTAVNSETFIPVASNPGGADTLWANSNNGSLYFGSEPVLAGVASTNTALTRWNNNVLENSSVLLTNAGDLTAVNSETFLPVTANPGGADTLWLNTNGNLYLGANPLDSGAVTSPVYISGTCPLLATTQGAFVPGFQMANYSISSNVQCCAPRTGTITYFAYNIPAALSGSGTYLIQLYKNNANFANVGTLSSSSGTSGAFTGLSIALSLGDIFYFLATPSSSPQSTTLNWSAVIQ